MASGGDSPEESVVAQEEQEEELDKNEEAASWSNLPAPVFSRLFSNLSNSFVHTARQVCPNWLTNAEHEVGLRVKIDDRLPGNIDFVKNVKIVQARIICWKTPTPIFMFPNCLKKLTISGILPPNWRLKELEEFPNLHHLVIRGAGLHSQDLTGNPLPPSPEPGSSSNGVDTNSMYEQYEPTIEAHPIWLRKLGKLEIIMNEYSYPSTLPLSVRLNDPDRSMSHEAFLKRLYLVVLNNVSYILNNVRSSHLHVCQIYVYPKAGILPPDKINWRHKPLQRFLSNHKRTMKDLFLPDFDGKHDNTVDDNLNSYPTKLRKFQIALSGFIGDKEEGREQNSSYWKKVLMEQNHLVDGYLILSDLPADWITDCLSTLTFASKEFLTYIDIVIEQEEETVQINLEMLTYCHKLQVLKLSGRENEIMIRNFCKLPASIKKIFMSMAMIELPDADLLKKFINLEMLEMKTVAIGGGGVDREHRHMRTLQMIQAFLELRKLSLLSIFFDFPLNPNGEVMEILSRLGQYYHRTYEAFSLKLNISYEMEAGWSEDVFDEDQLQIEYINSREPEEYSTRAGRHRNAISVDDEDHRLFVFQALPFLVNIRGMGGRRRRHAQNDDDGHDDDDDADDDDDDDDEDWDVDGMPTYRSNTDNDEPDGDDSNLTVAVTDPPAGTDSGTGLV